MLKELSGTTHTVTTGIALGHISESKEIEFVQNHSRTVVEMKSLSAKEIERYVLTEEPMDKAGGYGIQGLGSSFVKGIGGCYFNVVGLPIQETCILLDDLNISYWSNKD
jgi:septum formation protein